MHRDIGCVSLENAGMEVNDCSGIERIFFFFSVGSQASLCVDVKKCPAEERICMMRPHISSFQHALVLTNDRMVFFFFLSLVLISSVALVSIL